VPDSEIAIPADVQMWLDNPPLLASEDPKLYYSLLRQVAKFVEPEGIIEWLWLKDVVDLSWEIQRLRRFKTDFIEEEGSRRFDRWSDANTKLVTIVIRDGLDYYERADKLVASLESRRNAVLREIEIRRDSLAQRIRKTSDEIIDGKFTEPSTVLVESTSSPA
jgi:hypothetical protein